MNSDIIYEILKYLHICPEENGGALLAKKTMLSQKIYCDLNQIIDKPIVFEIVGSYTSVNINAGVIIYWGDGTMGEHLNKARHMYSKFAKYVVKIFAKDAMLNIRVPKNVIDIHSIKRLIDLSYMFDHCGMAEVSGKKWDTTNVINTEGMFYYCTELTKIVSKNWNTSNIENMSSMFSGCCLINQNIGKHWDTFKVTDMTEMFHDCSNLDKNIGKNWNTENVVHMPNMFLRCFKLNRPIGLNWDTSNLRNIEGIFGNCYSLSQSIGKNWVLSDNIFVD